MTQGNAKDIGLLGRIIQQRERRMLKLSQRLRRVQITEHAPAVVFENFGGQRNITFRRPLDDLNGAADCGNQVWQFEFFTRNEINHTIEETGVAQFIAADSDVFRAFLPGEVVLPRDSGKAARLNRVEHAIANT